MNQKGHIEKCFDFICCSPDNIQTSQIKMP